jgi:DNA-directed RNA polymerase specialized sigma24 family protein
VSPPPDLTSHLGRALAGDEGAIGALVTGMTPVIQARAARALMRGGRGRGQGRDVRQELADLVQDVLLLLFREDGRILRAWRSDGGLSFLNYVGLVAEREVGQIARSGRRSPWALDPAEQADIEQASASIESPEGATASREVFDRLIARLEGELHENALYLFKLLVVEELPAAEVCALTGLSTDAVYTWRSRLLRRARELLTELSRMPDSSPPRPRP